MENAHELSPTEWETDQSTHGLTLSRIEYDDIKILTSAVSPQSK
jgi:hypothetical protein